MQLVFCIEGASVFFSNSSSFDLAAIPGVCFSLIEDLVTLIYDHYAEFQRSNTPLNKESYKAIRDQIALLDSAEQAAIVDLVNLLCSALENAG